MISDANTIVDLFFQTAVGMSSGSFVLMGFLALLCVGVVLILAKAKISTVLVSGTCIIFVFAFFDPVFMVMFWAAVVVSLLMLINGLRKQFTGQ